MEPVLPRYEPLAEGDVVRFTGRRLKGTGLAVSHRDPFWRLL